MRSMSRRSYSKHVPDFRLVSYFAERELSAVHRMSPWTKLALLVLVVGFVTVLTDTVLLLVLWALTLCLYAAGRLPVPVLIGWYALPVFLVFSLAVLFLFTEPGGELLGVDLLGSRLSITDSGVLLLVDLTLRALAVVNLSLAVVMTTRYKHIAYVAYKILPETVANIFLLSYRFMFETANEISDVLDAMHSRGGNLARGLTRQFRIFAGIFGLALVHSFERGETVAKAMEARGFSGQFPVSEPAPRPAAGGYALVALSTLILAISAYSRYFDQNLIGW